MTQCLPFFHAPGKPRIMRRLSLFFATGLGLGYLPWAPGTFGTLWGLLLFYLGRGLSAPLFAGGTLGLILLAVFFSHFAERALGGHDSSKIVIDEVVGYLVTVLFLPFNAKIAVLAFILFRLFDILKPYPIRWIDRTWGGAWGVVMDDVAAGVFANISLRVLLWGMEKL